MKPRFLIAALALAYASHSATTYAQAFLSDPRLAEGRGIKTGNFELHPGIAAEGGYDSNYFQAAGIEGRVPSLAPGSPQVTVDEPVIDAYRLRITPSLSLFSRGARGIEEGAPLPALTLNAHMSAAYSALFAADSKYSSQVSNQDDVAAAAGFGVGILPGRTWGGDLGVDYNRIIEASNVPEISNAFKRDNIRGGGGIQWRPGGGLFTWRVGYQANATFFEVAPFTNLANIRHTLQLAGSWRFLPRTALIYRGNATWLRYTASTPPSTLGDGESIDSQIGINGLVSNYFGILGMIGWAGTFYTPRSGSEQNFDSLIGQAQVTWYPHTPSAIPEGGVNPAGPTTGLRFIRHSESPTPVGLSSVALGYVRSVSPSYLGTYFQRDRGYLNMAYFFGERFVLSLAGGFSHIKRPPTFFTGGAQQATAEGENRIDAVAFLEYRIGPSVGVNLTYRYDAELNHRVYPFDLGAMALAGDDLYFNRHQVYLGVRWFL